MFEALCVNEFGFDGTLGGHDANYYLAGVCVLWTGGGGCFRLSAGRVRVL